MTLNLRTQPGSAFGHLYCRGQKPVAPPEPEETEDEPEDDEPEESANKSVTNPFDLGGKMKISDLKKCLEKAADYEDAKAKEHYAEHKAGGLQDSHHLRLGDLHKGSAVNLRDGAAKCDKTDEADDLSKSASADLLKTITEQAKRITILENTVQPSRISGVAPDRPGSVRPVLRHGQQPLERPTVPLAFEHLSRIEE